MAIARLNVAVVLDRDGEGVVTAARISPGAVLARPGRIAAAEEVLLGRRPDPALISRAAAQVGDALAAAGRRWSTPYKEPAITALTERAIKQALEVDWR
jgi:CO/xanthine dehydrogenase FAD-binding subunit